MIGGLSEYYLLLQKNSSANSRHSGHRCGLTGTDCNISRTAVGIVVAIFVKHIIQLLHDHIDRGHSYTGGTFHLFNDLTLDFAECDYVSSAGIRQLLSAFKRIKAAKGRMQLSHVGENFTDVLENTGLDAVFDIL